LPALPRKALIALLLLAVAGVGAAFLPMRQLITDAAGWLRTAGVGGMLAFAGAYAVLTVIFVPRAALNLMAGWLYGVAVGTAAAVTGSMFGAWIAFIIGRVFMPDVVDRMVTVGPIRALDVVARRHPTRLTMLWHFSLVLPFAFINYYMGGARVKTFDFLLGKLIGVFPATMAYVYLGTLVPDLVALAEGRLTGEAQTMRVWISVVGVAITVAVMFWIGRVAQRALSELEVSSRPDREAAGSR